MLPAVGRQGRLVSQTANGKIAKGTCCTRLNKKLATADTAGSSHIITLCIKCVVEIVSSSGCGIQSACQRLVTWKTLPPRPASASLLPLSEASVQHLTALILGLTDVAEISAALAGHGLFCCLMDRTVSCPGCCHSFLQCPRDGIQVATQVAHSSGTAMQVAHPDWTSSLPSFIMPVSQVRKHYHAVPWSTRQYLLIVGTCILSCRTLSSCTVTSSSAARPANGQTGRDQFRTFFACGTA